jgi:hypothetical protein
MHDFKVLLEHTGDIGPKECKVEHVAVVTPVRTENNQHPLVSFGGEL